ncbi:hypothetical protein [Collimonas fungivorans]|uniref:hypothetical protein n=1 Tax=Collimonas fungivorans TaxID=158899 RepID=UPI0026F30619|nr:hypothetical protein [Collimonas fungivorans]
MRRHAIHSGGLSLSPARRKAAARIFFSFIRDPSIAKIVKRIGSASAGKLTIADMGQAPGEIKSPLRWCTGVGDWLNWLLICPFIGQMKNGVSWPDVGGFTSKAVLSGCMARPQPNLIPAQGHVPQKTIENVMNCHDNSISMGQHVAMNLLCWGKK